MNPVQVRNLSDQVKTALSVAELKSFFAAEIRLKISQKTVSSRIISLEKKGGFPIFSKTGFQRKPVLTERGLHLLTLANLAVQVYYQHRENSAELAQQIYDIARS